MTRHMDARRLCRDLLFLLIFLVMTSAAYGQGSIFGSVTNSDASVPANGEMSFFGYLDNTDEEIRIETSVGAGYDAGNWFDDFQNYLTEAPGNPYAYHFYNIANGEGFVLSKLIPNNSFQQEDILLAPVVWPAAPQGLAGQALSTSAILITWNGDPSLTYHVYRRAGTSDGSFFRIDDPTGSLASPGVQDSFYIDATALDSLYNYLIIAQDTSGNLSPHSDFITVDGAVPVAPVIASITPDSGYPIGGMPITIYGSGFDPAGMTATIGDSTVTSLTVVSPYEITGITPPGLPGVADVVVTNIASGMSSDPLVGGFLYIGNESPVVAGIPDSTIVEGDSFGPINLNDYVTDPDNADSEMVWTYSGASELIVNIDIDRIAIISAPNPDWFGVDTIVFRATDPGGQFGEDTAVYTITPVNDTPVVAGILDQTIDEGASFVPVTLDDYVVDPDNADSEMVWTYSGNAELTVDIDVNRVATISTPNPNWFGADTIVFRATDPGGLFGEDTAIYTVTAVNDSPLVAGIPDQTIDEGGTFAPDSLDVYVFDPDNAPDEMTWSYSGNGELIVDINPSRIASVTTPDSNWFGTQLIVFRATDPGGAYGDDTVTYTVMPVNDTPIVADIPDQSISEGGAFAPDTLDNYVSDVDNADSEMVWTYSGAAELTVDIDINRIATISAPNPDWYGVDTIVFRATDPGGLFGEDTSIYMINPVNDTPQVADIPDQTIDEGGTFDTVNLDDYVFDPDNADSELVWTYSGNLELNVNINPDRKAAVTPPSAEWSGSETIIFRAIDPGGAFGEDTAIYTVTAVNDSPLVANIPDQSISEGGTFAPDTLDNYVSDPDNTPDEMTWSYSGNGELIVDIDANRIATVSTPNPNWFGSEQIVFRATDPDGAFGEDTAIFTVIGVNNPPLVSGIPDQTIAEGGTFTGVALDNYVTDPDNPDSAMTWSYSGNNDLSVAIDANRIATITTPNKDWFGADTIIFRATDPDSLFDQDTAIFTVTPVNDAPVVSGIPDQAIIGDTDFAAITLDNYASDIDGSVSDLSWSFSGETDLSISIMNRIAIVSIPDSSWVGSEAIRFRATDTGLAYDQDTANFVHVAADMPENDFHTVLINHPDSLMFSIATPPGFAVDAPQIIPTQPSVVVRRADGSPIDAVIPANATTDYWVVWTPADTMTGPGSISISSISLDNATFLPLNGRGVMLDILPPFAQHDFGDVNRVDRRAADTLDIQADIVGNIDGRISGVVVRGDSTEFTALAPLVGDSLATGTTLRLAVLAYPRNLGIRSAEVWIRYEVDLPDGLALDSIMLIDLTASGVDPGCVIAENVVDFGERKIGETHSLTFTISNASTVPEVIDSLYFMIYKNIFIIDTAVTRPLFLPPGDTDITVFFVPLSAQPYSAQLYVTDSLASGNCSPPTMQGTGVADYVHWSVQPAINFGSVKLCDSAVYTGYWIRNRTATDTLIIDTIMIDSSSWFVIDPDPATLTDAEYRPSDSIKFSRIAFHPRDLLTPQSFAMTLVYHVDTVGAPIDTLRIIPVSNAGGCAGRLTVASAIAFDTVDINLYDLDTLVLTNPGSCSLDIDSITVQGQGFALPGFSAPRSIPAGGTLRITARFDPTNLGLHTGQLTIYHDGYVGGFDPDTDCPLESQDEVQLSGYSIDISPPAISLVLIADCGRRIDLNISDIGSGVDSAYSLWRAGNSSGGFMPTGNDLVNISGDWWQLTFSDSDMPPDSVAMIGYELVVYATDFEGLTDTLTASIPGCIPYEDGAAMIAGPTWLGGNGRDTLWHLVSFPGHLPSYRADSIFEMLSGMPPSTEADNDTWRLYEYRNQSFASITTDSPNQRVLPGKGYWFRHFFALDTLRLDTAGLASTWPTYTPFSIRLAYGWNLIGSPFLFPVSIDERLLDVNKVSSFVSQARPAVSGGGGWWDIADTAASLPQLMPWQGYAIRCEDPAGYTIYLDPHYNPVQGVSSRDSWTGAIFLRSGGHVIGRVDVGINPVADDGVDIRDIRPIDFFAAKTNLVLTDKISGDFIRDVRNDGRLQVWRLDYSQAGNDASDISWTAAPLPRDSMTLALRDIVTDTVVDMTANSSYRIENPSQMPSGRLVIYLGDKSAVEAAINEQMTTAPASYKLYQNYPNPFNPATTIAYDLSSPAYVNLVIFDITGRKIRTLQSGYREAGSYQVIWDGRDDEGKRAASGIYLYRLQADKFTQTRKLMLLK